MIQAGEVLDSVAPKSEEGKLKVALNKAGRILRNIGDERSETGKIIKGLE